MRKIHIDGEEYIPCVFFLDGDRDLYFVKRGLMSVLARVAEENDVVQFVKLCDSGSVLSASVIFSEASVGSFTSSDRLQL